MKNAKNGFVKWKDRLTGATGTSVLLCNCTGDDWTKDLSQYSHIRVGVSQYQCPKCNYGMWYILPQGMVNSHDVSCQKVKK